MPEESDRVVDEATVDWTEYDHGGRSFRRKQLGAAAGSERLGCSLYEVPPGKRTWHRHYHEGNEEAVYVLSGSGTVALGPDAEPHQVDAGDFVALPAGEDGAHEVTAGEDGLRYLAVSTMRDPDVTVYPDRGSIGVFAGAAPGGDAEERSLSTYLDADAEVPYWDDEETTPAEERQDD